MEKLNDSCRSNVAGDGFNWIVNLRVGLYGMLQAGEAEQHAVAHPHGGGAGVREQRATVQNRDALHRGRDERNHPARARPKRAERARGRGRGG